MGLLQVVNLLTVVIIQSIVYSTDGQQCSKTQPDIPATKQPVKPIYKFYINKFMTEGFMHGKKRLEEYYKSHGSSGSSSLSSRSSSSSGSSGSWSGGSSGSGKRHRRRRRRRGGGGSSSKCYKDSRRKDYRMLSRTELDTFHKCLQMLKKDTSSRGYDAFARMHEFDQAPAAHLGVSFIPWHRYFLHIFEQALRSQSKKCACVSIPFWDAAVDQQLPSPADAATWTSEYWGNTKGVVTTGKLCPNWRATENCRDIGISGRLTRDVTGEPFEMYSVEIINDLYTARTFTELTAGEFGDMSLFEADHGLGHCYVGNCTNQDPGCVGHLGCVDCSPNDAMFFLHHSFVDYLWWEWGRLPGRTNTYPPCSSDIAGGDIHCGNADMQPFPGIKNVDGISKYAYNTYHKRPSAISCRSDADCYHATTKLLWCDKDTCACKAKVKEGGNCDGLPGNACYCSRSYEEGYCDNDKCRCRRRIYYK